MKNEYNKKKKATIIALSLVATCLAVGLFYYVGKVDNTKPQESSVESKPIDTEILIPDVPNVILNDESNNETGTSDYSSDLPTGKPVAEQEDKLPMAKPAKAPEESTAPAQQPKTEDGKDRTPPPDKDHDFTPESPDKKPEYKPEQSKPNDKSDQPKDGEKSDGKIYVPGFGWIEDQGGGSNVHEAPNAGTGEKVGDM